MATARKITDFMSSGTHAARPATPPGLGTGEIAIYYETDTLHMFAYVSGAWTQIDSSSVTASIVQNKAVSLAAHSTGITLSSAPVQGNLLVAMVTDQTSFPTAGAGWTLRETQSATHDDAAVLWKLAGAGESATQTPCSDGHAGTIAVYEINNGAPGAVTIAVDFNTNAAAESPVNTKLSTGGGLIVGCFVNRTTNAPTSITGTGVTADGTASALSRFCANFHISSPVNGTNSVTANYAGTEGGVFIGIAVG